MVISDGVGDSYLVFLWTTFCTFSRVGSSDTWRAKSYVASGIIICKALFWIFFTELFCSLVSPPCHTWQAYSTTGQTREQYMAKSLSIETLARLRTLRKYNRWDALEVMASIWASHDRLSLIVRPSNLVFYTFSISCPPICRLGMWFVDHAKFIVISFVYWITLCFRRSCFCCSQIWRTRHRHIVIFTRSNRMDSKGCQPFK